MAICPRSGFPCGFCKRTTCHHKVELVYLGNRFFYIFRRSTLPISIILLFSALGVIIRQLDGLLSWMENTANAFWFVFAIINMAIIISSWATGIPKIEETSWLFHPYIWSVPVWLILFTAIQLVVGFSPIFIHIRRDGRRLTIRRYSLILAFAFAILALLGMLTNAFNVGWILAFQSLTVVFVLARMSIRD
jgi:hypothetical protein